MDAPIQDRKRLVDLRNWVTALNARWSYRQIAAKTWRGPSSHGYWERVAKGAHLERKPFIRPRWQDWHDISLLYKTVVEYELEDGQLFDAAMDVIGALSDCQRKVAGLFAIIRKRTGAKTQ